MANGSSFSGTSVTERIWAVFSNGSSGTVFSSSAGAFSYCDCCRPPKEEGLEELAALESAAAWLRGNRLPVDLRTPTLDDLEEEALLLIREPKATFFPDAWS